MSRLVRGLVSGLVLAGALGCGDDGGSGSSDGSGEGGARVTFTRDVHPILVAKCGDSTCHGTSDFGLPGHGAADVDDAYEAVTGLSYAGGPVYERILVRVSADAASEMPPGCRSESGQPNCISAAELEILETWVEQGHPR
jgi:hypothetical protein